LALAWTQTEVGSVSWEAALQSAEDSELAGYSDWRLPNIKELRSISNDNLSNPSLDSYFFPDANSDKYWSSTTEVNNTGNGWCVDFETGLVSYEDKESELNVKFVRNISNEITSISDNELIQDNVTLSQNYPNPFNPTTTIKFSLGQPGDVQLVVYNVSGQEVSKLVSGSLKAGSHSASFNANNLNSGVYYYQLKTNKYTITKKMILVK